MRQNILAERIIYFIPQVIRNGIYVEWAKWRSCRSLCVKEPHFSNRKTNTEFYSHSIKKQNFNCQNRYSGYYEHAFLAIKENILNLFDLDPSPHKQYRSSRKKIHSGIPLALTSEIGTNPVQNLVQSVKSNIM